MIDRRWTYAGPVADVLYRSKSCNPGVRSAMIAQGRLTRSIPNRRAAGFRALRPASWTPGVSAYLSRSGRSASLAATRKIAPKRSSARRNGNGSVGWKAVLDRPIAPSIAVRCSHRPQQGEGRSSYSITLSAKPSIAIGIVRPSACAVFRLTISSNRLGCSTGRSSGLAPLKILST